MLKKTLFALIAVSMIVYANGITKAQDPVEVDITEAAVITENSNNNNDQCNSCVTPSGSMQQDCAANIPCPLPCESACVPPCEPACIPDCDPCSSSCVYPCQSTCCFPCNFGSSYNSYAWKKGCFHKSYRNKCCFAPMTCYSSCNPCDPCMTACSPNCCYQPAPKSCCFGKHKMKKMMRRAHRFNYF